MFKFDVNRWWYCKTSIASELFVVCCCHRKWVSQLSYQIGFKPLINVELSSDIFSTIMLSNSSENSATSDDEVSTNWTITGWIRLISVFFLFFLFLNFVKRSVCTVWTNIQKEEKRKEEDETPNLKVPKRSLHEFHSPLPSSCALASNTMSISVMKHVLLESLLIAPLP